MNRRDFLRTAGVAAAGVAARRIAGAEGLTPRKPNIIFIMADDMGMYDLGCYGQKLIRTPCVDKLAAEGVKFTQCYAGSTVCAPSRSCLMTGQHTGHTRVRANFARVGGTPPQGRVPLRPEDVTVAEVLKAAGYATAITGKWGLGEPNTTGVPNRQGFDEWLGYLNQRRAHSYYPDSIWKNEQKHPLPGNTGGKRTQYTHDLFTEFALDFISRRKAKPFFLYMAYTIPHGKYEVPSDAPYTDRKWSAKLKNYAAMVTRLDRDVGRIMARLKTLGLDDDTVVFFTSDNGAAFHEKTFRSAGPLRGRKGSLYEGGIRVPMIVRWPGRIEPATTSDEVWAFWDFLPTAAEIAGGKPPKNIDGISMLPAILGQLQKAQHDVLYWEYTPRGFAQAVRMGRWKAIRPGAGKPLELYDLKTDPTEKNNVAADHPDVVAKAEAHLKTCRTESEHWPTGR